MTLDIFYRVFNPAVGTFVTDEIRLTDTVEADYVTSVTAGETGDFTIIYNEVNAVLTGSSDIDFIGDELDNVVTGNLGDNVIDGGDGNDTFITQGNFDTFNTTYNLDGSVSLNSECGTDKLINIEFVEFDDGIKTISDVIGPVAPTSITLDNLSVDENAPGAHIANITGDDFNNDALTFSIVEGEGDANMFMIMNNMLHLKTYVIADYETSRELEVTIRATDQDDLSIEKLFTIDVNDDKSDNTSDTEVTFSANLDDLGTFTNDPNFYFKVNGELNGGNGVLRYLI